MSSNPGISWRFLSFDALTPPELYAVLQLRSEVFVVEQACIFQDMDGADAQAMHLLGTRRGQLVAYARCFAAGVKFAEASIGRVVTHASARGGGIGHHLMKEAVGRLQQQWGSQPIRIGAQARLEQFYLQHGFANTGQPYIEDGIPHIEMLRVA
ncbi:MAG: GNAT family N-acetyltransferase [Polaromonas sp.]|uniref:GNAT family N-acetyltransferase n=1 Tax=Polaromonas sp. TaxID=1869339 RepID=UPI003267EE61